jgi:hypothetical protein
MMTLGSYQFQLSTAAFQELNRVDEYRWAAQDRFSLAPVLQYLGEGTKTIALPGVIYPAFLGGLGQIEAMRAEAGQGEPLTMIDGMGSVLGRWVIERIEERQAKFGPSGAPLCQEFTLNLRKFDELRPAADIDGFDIGDIGAVVNGGAVELAQGTASKMGVLVSSLNEAAAGIQSFASQVQQTVQPAIDAVRTGITAAQNMKNAALDAQKLVKTIGTINSLSSAEAALGGMMRVASSTNAMASGASKLLSGYVTDMTTRGEPSGAIAAVKKAMVSVNQVVVTNTAARTTADNIKKAFAL